jgi:hypothetical protein
MKCLTRGHRSGKCSEADEEKWLRLKTKGAFSRSHFFTYLVDKKAIVREVIDAFGDALKPEFLQPHLRKWLNEERRSYDADEAIPSALKNLRAPKIKKPIKAKGGAIVLPPHLSSTMPRQRCSKCLDNEHLTADCVLEGPCEYCGKEHHNVSGCLILHGLCNVCLRRGHRNGACDSADEEKWNACKGLGYFAKSPKFMFQLDQQEVVKEVKLVFGHERLLKNLQKLPAYISEPLSNDANFIKFQAKLAKMSSSVDKRKETAEVSSRADEVNETVEEEVVE